MTSALVKNGSYSLRAARPRSLSRDVLDHVLFLPSICLACGLGISLRLIGPLFVVAPLGSCLIFALLRRTVPPRLLSAYIAFCIFVAALSSMRLFPTSWQIYFMEEAVVRQLIPLLGFFAVGWASKAYFRRRLYSGDPLWGGPFFLFLGLVVGPAVMFQQGLRYQGADPATSIVGLYGALINNVVIVMFFVTGYIFLTNDWRRYAGLVTIVAIAVVTHFASFRILTLVALAAFFGAPGRIVVIAAMAILIGTYAIGLGYIPEAMLASPNSGIRLAFMADAFTSVSDTYGIGIGYGKESVRWRYQFPNLPVFTFLPDPSSISPERMPDRMHELLSVGVHNSFIQSLLRTGLVGLVLFVAAFAAAFPPGNVRRGQRNHAAVVFFMIFIACFVNPALESPVQAVAIGFVYGYLLALRASARACHLSVACPPRQAPINSSV
jgi:O-antigen ligase